MKKFLNLCEQFDPQNTEDPKWKLIDFLKSKGVNVSMVRGTDMLYIDTGTDTIAVNIANTDEDSQETDMVSDIAKDPSNKLQSQASRLVKKRDQLAPKVINNTNKKMGELEKTLNKPSVI